MLLFLLLMEESDLSVDFVSNNHHIVEFVIPYQWSSLQSISSALIS